MEIKELGDCVELIIDYRGKTPQKMGSDWEESGYRVISAKNVHNGMITDEDSIRCVNQQIYEKWMKEEIKRGDCLLASEGASLGESAIWDSDEKMVLGQRLYAIRADNVNLDSWYLAYYMQTEGFRKQVAQSSTGSTVFGISQPVLCSLKLILPDIEIQRRIGQIYKVILKKLINNQGICSDLEKIQELFFDKWFMQYEFPNHNREPYKTNNGTLVYNELLEKKIPEGWKVFRFGDLFEFVKGKIPKETFDKKRQDSDVRYLTIEVLNGALPEYCDSEGAPITDGEVLMVMDGAASGEVYVGNQGAIGSTLAKLDIKCEGLSHGLLYVILCKYQDVIKKVNTGSTVPHANKDYINDLVIALPQNEELKALSKEFDLIVKLQNNCKEEIMDLKYMRDYTLPLLMNGQAIIA